jgi:hypothetical protein
MNDKNKQINKKMRQKFIAEVEDNFYKVLKNDNHPIILGGAVELTALYNKLNSDQDVLKSRITGNLDKENFDILHYECLKILNEHRAQNDQSILSFYQEMKCSGKVIEDLNEITLAAIQGRIRNLMVASDRFLWGKLDKITGKISNHINKNLAIPEDDILDDLAEIVIARGGNITLLKFNKMPSVNEAIALLK